MKLQILELINRGDARGFSFSPPSQALDFVGGVGDILLASLTKDAVRGNHFHLRKRQANIVLPGSPWVLRWDDGEKTAAQERVFDGSAAVLLLIPPGVSHAVRNDGDEILWLVACSSDAYDPKTVIPRKVL